MKGVITIFGMAAAGLIGYLAEPSLRLQLTGVAPGSEDSTEKRPIKIQLADGIEQVELDALTPDQLPKTIKLNVEAKISDPASGIAMTIPPGHQVDLVRVEGSDLVISQSNGQYQGKVAAMDTDLLQQLAANPPSKTPPAPEPAPEPPAPPAGESEEPAPAPEPPPEPEPAPEPEPEPTPAPAPDPIAIPEPAPIDPATAGGDTASEGAEEIVKAMQESVKAGAVKEFTFEQVTDWTPGASETIDGNTYQTGIASYSAETIFGMKKIQAKALIKDAKVLRWIWPKSGMEIK